MIGLSIRSFIKEINENGGVQTIRHIQNVANYMAQFASYLGEDEETWFYGGFLHDAGKIFIPKEILSSKRRISDKEYEIIKKHVISGNGVILSMKIPESYKMIAANCSKFHHLNYKGGGYGYLPLSGESIPKEARACKIADCFAAMTEDRSYSAAMTPETAVGEMNSMLQNGHFDPLLYKIFIEKIIGLKYAISA